jgi:hypothetical protein
VPTGGPADCFEAPPVNTGCYADVAHGLLDDIYSGEADLNQ